MSDRSWGTGSTSRTASSNSPSFSLMTKARISPEYGVPLAPTPTINFVPTIELNGHPTWVSISTKKRPTVVFLHGGLSSSASMLRTLGPRLGKKFRIAAFDRRGHGRTADTSEAFHYDAMATETVAFLQHLGKPAHLVGHSDGGVVAL